jgi:hypothetical protein
MAAAAHSRIGRGDGNAETENRIADEAFAKRRARPELSIFL